MTRQASSPHLPASETTVPQAKVVVIGAGPAGLAAAEAAAAHGVSVVIHERMPNPARKFLLAGRGGLNLTHSEPLTTFIDRYGAAGLRLSPAIRAFPPEALRAWCEGLGVPTFVGSSGRIFPRAMKASPLLRAWLGRLAALGVTLETRSRWLGWEDDRLRFETPSGLVSEQPAATVFALGGASWPRLGSDGAWQGALAARGASIVELRPANCGVQIAWSDVVRARFAGAPLKPAAFAFGGVRVRGEAVITRNGLEGGAIYALSALLRDAVARDGGAELEIDLRPDTLQSDLVARFEKSEGTGVSSANRLRRAGLSPAAASLLRHRVDGPALPSSSAALAQAVKQCRLLLTGIAPIERAISTAGGIGWAGVSEDYSLVCDQAAFVCGEMLDWEAPTGGYLLQACIATGRAAGDAAGLRAREALGASEF